MSGRKKSAEGARNADEPRTSPAYYDDPSRRKGELPANSLKSDVSDLVGRIGGSPITQQERVAARFLDRLSVPMLELDDVTDGFETWEEVGDACRKVLREERSADLGQELGYSARRVLAVARVLGYQPAGDE